MRKVKVGLIAAEWHLQSFVLMKLGGKPQKESQTKHILGTWCRYLKHKTILIFEYPSIPVWGYECPTKRNLSFIEYFPKSNYRLELSSFWEQIYAFQVTKIALGCNGGGVARRDFVRSLIRSWAERRDLKCEKRPDHPGLSPAPIFQILLHATLNAGRRIGLERDKQDHWGANSLFANLRPNPNLFLSLNIPHSSATLDARFLHFLSEKPLLEIGGAGLPATHAFRNGSDMRLTIFIHVPWNHFPVFHLPVGMLVWTFCLLLTNYTTI